MASAIWTVTVMRRRPHAVLITRAPFGSVAVTSVMRRASFRLENAIADNGKHRADGEDRGQCRDQHQQPHFCGEARGFGVERLFGSG